MFDLEQSIAEWRQQMLTSGIKAPELIELESHLREEIEALTKSGSLESEAFQSAVKKIGRGTALRNEFQRAGASRRKFVPKIVWRALIFSVLAEALCVAVYFLMWQFDGYHRFFGEFGNPTSFWSDCLCWFHVPAVNFVVFLERHPLSFPGWTFIDPLVLLLAMFQWFFIFLVSVSFFHKTKRKLDVIAAKLISRGSKRQTKLPVLFFSAQSR